MKDMFMLQVFIGLCLVCVLVVGTMMQYTMNDVEPAAGSVEQGVQVRATFQHAFLNYMDVNHDGVVRTTAVPLQLKGCRGANITSRRCIRVLVEQAGMLHVAFPPNPLGLPAQLENTWMEVVYF